jgi:hypothetical protein
MRVSLLCLPPLAQTSRELSKELNVTASEHWIDTGIDLRAGDSPLFTTIGSLDLGAGKSAGPQRGAQADNRIDRNFPRPALLEPKRRNKLSNFCQARTQPRQNFLKPRAFTLYFCFAVCLAS